MVRPPSRQAAFSTLPGLRMTLLAVFSLPAFSLQGHAREADNATTQLTGLVEARRADRKSVEAWHAPSDPYYVLKTTRGDVILRPSAQVSTFDFEPLNQREIRVKGWHTQGNDYKAPEAGGHPVVEAYPLEMPLNSDRLMNGDLSMNSVSAKKAAKRGAGFVVTALVSPHPLPQPFTQKNGRMGYQNAAGKVLIPAQFSLAEPFSLYGIAAVVDEQGWVLIDTKGQKQVRPFVFDNGPDAFSEGLARFVDKGKVGFFNQAGVMVIPARYDFAEPFKAGRARVCMGCQRVSDGEHAYYQGGQWMTIDRQGTVF